MEDNELRYLQWVPDYFWKWEEETEVIARSTDGETIAYTKYVVQVLEHLHIQGWPPFGTLLLALSATNGNASVTGLLQQLVVQVKACQAYLQLTQQVTLLEEAAPLLDILESLPVAYRTGAGRLRLFQALFHDCHNRVAAARTQKWLPGIQQYKKQAAVLQQAPAAGQRAALLLRNYERDFKVLSLLARRYPDAASVLTAVTGLPDAAALPALPLEEENEADVADFTAQLTANPKTFELGALLKHIWSGLHIPLHHTLVGGQPLGGVSDLTNKGNYDRLLLSEFANDDLVLLSRLANNEALFLHREVPPASDDFERIILIDASLKNWGTPRLLAYALALAIGKHPKTDIRCRVFAVGKKYVPVYYNDVDEVIESLGHMDTGLHAAAGLQQFFESIDTAKRIEVLFISGEEACKHAEVQKVTYDYYRYFQYWFMITATGAIDVYKRSHNSKKAIQHIQLPLQQLWQKSSVLKDIPVAEVVSAVPVRGSVLYPASNNIRRVLTTGNGEKYIITGNKLLFRTYEGMEKRGWEYIPFFIPTGSVLFELGVNNTHAHILLCFNATDKEIVLLNLESGKADTLLFPEWSNSDYPEFFFYAGAFYYMNQHHCWAIELNVKPAITRYPVVGNRLKKAWQNRMDDLTALNNYFNGLGVKPCLKKLQRVFLNTEGNLVFNDSHVLIINPRGVIKLLHMKGERTRQDIAATYNMGDDCFVFADGSKVRMDEGGMIILEARNASNDMVFDVVAAGGQKFDRTIAPVPVTEIKRDEELNLAFYQLSEHTTVLTSFVQEPEARIYAEKMMKNGIQVIIEKVRNSAVVFLPAVLDTPLAIGTPYYFGGDKAYYPYFKESLAVRQAPELYKRSITYFIRNIKQYAAGRSTQ